MAMLCITCSRPLCLQHEPRRAAAQPLGPHGTDPRWPSPAYPRLGIVRLRRPECSVRWRERGLILGFGLWRGLMLDRLPVLGQPAPHALDQLPRIPLTLFRRHLIKPVLEGSADVDLLSFLPPLGLSARQP